MNENPFYLEAYLARINYHDSLAPTPKTLLRLHRAQAQSIPFENLDIFLGRSIRLDPAGLVAKLVDARRGGYCYELNGLFLLVLRRLGFNVTPLAARILQNEKPIQKSHQLTLVTFGDERWIADVGFGGNGLIEAIPLETSIPYDQQLDTYRLVDDARLGFVLQHRLGDAWRSLYAFTLEEHYPEDYAMMNYFNSTSPASVFTQHRICVIATPDARIVLRDNELKIRRSGETFTQHITDEPTYRETLQRYFGITLPPEAVLKAFADLIR